MRARKIGIQNEYIENVDTPIVRGYNKLSDVPKEPADTFADRYVKRKFGGLDHKICSVCLRFMSHLVSVHYLSFLNSELINH